MESRIEGCVICAWEYGRRKGRNIKNLTDDSEKPVGEWNSMLIEAVGNEIKVWVNGDLVNHGYNCTAEKGQIALQAEGSEVEFRKVELTAIIRILNDQLSGLENRLSNTGEK